MQTFLSLLSSCLVAPHLFHIITKNVHNNSQLFRIRPAPVLVSIRRAAEFSVELFAFMFFALLQLLREFFIIFIIYTFAFCPLENFKFFGFSFVYFCSLQMQRVLKICKLIPISIESMPTLCLDDKFSNKSLDDDSLKF